MNDVAKLPLAIETQARPEDLSVLSDGLSHHAGEATGIRDGALLCVFVRGGDQTVGGAYGWTWGGGCYIRYLFVPEDMLGRGLGTRIMGEVEREARVRGCRQIILENARFPGP